MLRVGDENSLRLRQYFDSIRQSCRETTESQRAKDWVVLLQPISFIIFFASLLTLIPRLFSELAAWFFKSSDVLIHGIRVSLSSVWLWWFVSTPLTLALFILVRKRAYARTRRRQKSWVPEPQMRFAYCYSVVDEISSFQTNGLQKHMDSALDNWKECQRLLYFMFRPFYMINMPTVAMTQTQFAIDPASESQQFALFLEVEELKRRFSWFRVQPDTDATLDALAALPSKIRDRLRDRKDLSQVGSCLLQLSAYLYSRIPDVPQSYGAESVEELGFKSRQYFVSELSLLPPYATESKPMAAKSSLLRSALGAARQFSSLWVHENTFVCFMAWWGLTLLLTLGSLIAVLHFLPKVVVDSAVVSLIVGVPLVCGVTAVALSRQLRAKQSPPEEK
jgi:hypothetical protein